MAKRKLRPSRKRTKAHVITVDLSPKLGRGVLAIAKVSGVDAADVFRVVVTLGALDAVKRLGEAGKLPHPGQRGD